MKLVRVDFVFFLQQRGNGRDGGGQPRCEDRREKIGACRCADAESEEDSEVRAAGKRERERQREEKAVLSGGKGSV